MAAPLAAVVHSAAHAQTAASASRSARNTYAARTYSIDPEVFKLLPTARVGVALVEIAVERQPKSKAHQNFISELKQSTVQNFLKKYPELDYKETQTCKVWANVFERFADVDAAEEKVCTIQNLFRRIAQEAGKIKQARIDGKKEPKADLGRVSNVVDLCNMVSVQTETPMGVMDYNSLSGDMKLRYGQEGETFVGLRNPTVYPVKPSHLVISDSARILAWLWTYKVGENVCVRESQEPAMMMVCADQPSSEAGDAEEAIRQFLKGIEVLGGKGHYVGVLSQESPTLTVDPSLLQ